MALSDATKNNINGRMHAALDRTGTPNDYMGVTAEVNSVRGIVQSAGWTWLGWIDAYEGSEPTNNVTLAKFVRIHKSGTVTRTRTPEHQALVEGLGQVDPGDNTYEGNFTRRISVAVGDLWPHPVTGEHESIDNPREVAAICLHAVARKIQEGT